MKPLTGAEFAAALGRHGWTLLSVHHRQRIYGKPGISVRISVPTHSDKPLKRGLLDYLLRMAGLDEADLRG
ncbi:MAG: type II toxin-antitoxin system HicA family toxin [Candidatus Hydrogenedentes bacterium]|nr:type II toxin-antitoxin system HicA family toxin [Candidatus Hydrogenedentota bacterium]